MALKYVTRTIWLLLLINTRQKALAELVECDVETQFRCKSGDLCIDSDLVQNGVPDCPDASDEECQEGEYACSCGTPRCISKDQILDGVADCTDGSDEGLSLPCYQEDGLQELLALERRRRSVSDDSEESPGSIDPASPSFERAYSTQVVGERPDLPDLVLNNDDSLGDEMEGKVISMLEGDITAEIFDENESGSLESVIEVEPAKPQLQPLATFRAGESLLTSDDQEEIIAKEEPKHSEHELDDIEGSVITEFTTTTILGFADFSTTIGSTVVIFSPNAAGPAFGEDMMSSLMMKISSTSKAELPARTEESKIELTTSMSASVDVTDPTSTISVEVSTETPEIQPDVMEIATQQKAEEVLNSEGKSIESVLDNELPVARSVSSGGSGIPVAPAVITALSEKEARSLNFPGDKNFVIVAADGGNGSPTKESTPIAEVVAKASESDEVSAHISQSDEALASEEAENIEEVAEAADVKQSEPLASEEAENIEEGAEAANVKQSEPLASEEAENIEEGAEAANVKQSEPLASEEAENIEEVAEAANVKQAADEETLSAVQGQDENVSDLPPTASETRTTREQPSDAAIENSITDPPTSTPSVLAPSITTEYTTYTVFKTLFNEETSKVLTKFTTVTNVITIDNLGHQVTMSMEPVPKEIVETTTQTFFMSAVVDGKTAVTSSTAVVTSVVSMTAVKAIENEDVGVTSDLEAAASFDAGDLQTEETTEVEAVESKAITITPSPVVLSEVIHEEEKKASVMVQTLTYATTFFRDGKTEVVTSEEVVTNTVTGEDHSVQPTVDLAITYYTTYTYSTTTISDGATYINTREETISNVVTPTVEAEKSMVPPVVATQSPAETTFYTTYTYYTTSFLGDDTIIDSSLETVTNVVTNIPTPTVEMASSVIEKVPVEEPAPSPVLTIIPTVEAVLEADNEARAIIGSHNDQAISKQNVEPTGLISVLSRTVVNEGTTTKFVTDIIGTYINGFYAEIHESSSEIIKPTPVFATSGKTAYSQNIQSAYDAGGATTTYFTILYFADGDDRFVQSTSSFRVNLALLGATQDPSKIGLIRKVEGTAISGDVTTAYESQYYGTVIDGVYTVATSATSNVISPSSVAVSPFVVEPTILAQDELQLLSSVSTIEGSIASTTSSTLALEGDAVEESATESTNKVGILKGRVTTRLSVSSRTRTFTPTIRPLSSRPRPTFSARVRNSEANNQGVDSSEESAKEVAPVRKPFVPTVKSSAVIEEETSTAPKNKFFRPRSSSANGVDLAPTPVIPRPAFTVTSRSRSQTPLRRPFTRPSAEKELVSEDTDETAKVVDNDLDKTSVTEEVSTTTRRSFTRAPTPAAVSNHLGLPQRRNFPLRRPNPTNEVEAQQPEQKPAVTSSVTTRPRFLTPPKLVFTEKLAVPDTDSSFRQRLNALRNRGSRGSTTTTTTTTTQEPPFRDSDEESKRVKRYAPDLYRPGRAAKGRAREIAPSFEYEYEYEYYDDTPSTTKSPPKTTRTTARTTTQRKTTSSPAVSFKSRLASARASTTKTSDSVNRFRKPAIESTSSRSSFRSSSSKSRTTTSRTTGRKISSSSKKGSSNKVRLEEPKESAPSIQSSFPETPQTITVTHKIPSETIIPIVENGQTVFKNVITATPSLEVLSKLSTIKVNGVNRLLASEISLTPSVGVTEITQYLVRSSETTLTEFTPTFINGRKTSFRHIIPSTVYEIESTTSAITDPIAQTNFLLQQILLGRGFPGQLPQQQPQPVNPLQNLLGGLGGLNQPLGFAPAEPVTSFSTRLTSYVTTITELKSTVLPITLRGVEVKTTLVKSSVNVVTATEVFTETIVSTPIQQAQPTANPLANLLPLLLANQAGVQQPVQTQIAQLPLINQPLSGIAKVSEIKPEQIESLLTSVVTLHVAGPTPGELSTVLHTVLFEGSPSPVTKRQAVFDAHEAVPKFVVPLFVQTDKGFFMLPDQYNLKDIDVYIMSAINNEGIELGPAYETDALDPSIVRLTSEKVKRQSNLFDSSEEDLEEALTAAQFEFPPIREREYVNLNRDGKANKQNDDSNSLVSRRVSKPTEKTNQKDEDAPTRKDTVASKKEPVTEVPEGRLQETPTPRKNLQVSVVKTPVTETHDNSNEDLEEEEYYDEYEDEEETDEDDTSDSNATSANPAEAEVTTFRNSIKIIDFHETEHNSLEDDIKADSANPPVESQTEQQTFTFTTGTPEIKETSTQETLSLNAIEQSKKASVEVEDSAPETKETSTQRTLPSNTIRQSKKVSVEVEDSSDLVDSNDVIEDLTIDQKPLDQDETLKSNVVSDSFGTKQRRISRPSTTTAQPIRQREKTTTVSQDVQERTPGDTAIAGRKVIHVPIKRKKTEGTTTPDDDTETTTTEKIAAVDTTTTKDANIKERKTIHIPIKRKKTGETTTTESITSTTTNKQIELIDQSSAEDTSPKNRKVIHVPIKRKKTEEATTTTTTEPTTKVETVTVDDSSAEYESYEYYDDETESLLENPNEVGEGTREPESPTTPRTNLASDDGHTEFKVTTFRSNIKIAELLSTETSSEDSTEVTTGVIKESPPTTTNVQRPVTTNSVSDVETTEPTSRITNTETTVASTRSFTETETTTQTRASEKDIFKQSRTEFEKTSRGRNRFTVTTTERKPPSSTEREPSARKISTSRRKIQNPEVQDSVEDQSKEQSNSRESVAKLEQKKQQNSKTNEPTIPTKPAVGIFDPRTYLTIYSYFYTVFDPIAPGSLISTRLVTISEVARGQDKKLPSDFSRTESSSGLYTIKTGSTFSDLGFTVDVDGVTTSTQVSSNLLVRYGRGKINIVPPSKVETTRGLERPFSGVSEPEELSLIEPSFVSPIDASDSEVSNQIDRSKLSLPRRFTVSTVIRSSALPATGSNRGRGTVRFGASLKDLTNKSVEDNHTESKSNSKPLRSFNRGRGQSTSNELDSSREARLLDDVSQESSTRKSVQTSRGKSRFQPPEPRKIEGGSKSRVEEQKFEFKLRGRTRLPSTTTESFRQKYRNRFKATTEQPELSEEYVDDVDQDVEEDILPESGEEYVDEEEVHDDANGSNEIQQEESLEQDPEEFDEEVVYEDEQEHEGSEETENAEEEIDPANVHASGEQSAQNSDSSIEPSATATETQRQTRTFTFKRRDPLEKHLSSIRANANRRTLRPNLKIGKQTVSNIAPTTDRISTTSTRRAFRPSNVVHKSFFITSTVPLHGGKKNVKLTLLTSTLTTLLDADLHLTTDSPELFNPLLKSETRFRRPSKASSILPTTQTEVIATTIDHLEGSGGISLEYSTELIETSFNDISMEPVPVTETPELSESIAPELSESLSSTETPELQDERSFVTVTETELRTYSVVVTSVAGTEQVVSTGIEIVPEEVVKTITLGFKSSPDTEEIPAILDNNEVPLGRSAGSGPVQIVDGSGSLLGGGVRTGRVSVGASRPNLATKVMSNGVEVIVAGDKKKPVLEALTAEAPKQLESSLSPELQADEGSSTTSVEDNQVGARIDSSIDDPLEFSTRSKLATFTSVSTLFENNQLVTSTKEEVVTEIVTERKGTPPLDLKTYFITETKTLTTVVNGQTVTNTQLVVATEVVPNEIANLDGSLNEPESDLSDLFDDDGPIVVTKTFFTTSTHYTTIFLDGQTVTKSRIEIASNVVEETITDGLQALKESLLGIEKPSGGIVPTPVLAAQTPEPEKPVDKPVVDSVVPNEAQLQALKETFLATSTESPSDTELEPSEIFGDETTEADLADLADVEYELDADRRPLGGTRPLGAILQPVAAISVLLEPTVAVGLGGAPQELAAGATVLAVSNAGSVVVVPTDVVQTTSSPGSSGTGGGLSNLLTIPSLSAIGTLGLSAIAQSLAANGGGGLNIQLGPVFNAVSGLLTGGLPFANKRNDTERRTDIDIGEEPKFIPIGAIARPEPRIPLQGVPLVPNAPGSPLLRPGANVDEFRAPVAPPGVPVATPNIILVHDPPQRLQTLQADRQPPQFFNDPKRPILFPQGSVPSPQDQPRQPSQGQLPPLFAQNPSRPALVSQDVPVAQPAARPPLFPGNVPVESRPVSSEGAQGKPAVPPSVLPGLNVIEREDDPSKIAPVIFKPVEDPRKPIPVPGPGSIVPGPNGPVRLIPVAGGKPPPGVEGTVFIRPVPETPTPALRRVDAVPSVQIVQPSKDVPNPPSMIPFIPSVVTILPSLSNVAVPNVQTIASIEGDNKIVRTNIISNGQTFVVEPTDSGRIRPSGQVVFPSAGLVFFPDESVSPTPVVSPATLEPEINSEEDEDADVLENVNIQSEEIPANAGDLQASSEADKVEEDEYETETEPAIEEVATSEEVVPLAPSSTTEKEQASPAPATPQIPVDISQPASAEAPISSDEVPADKPEVGDAEEAETKKEPKMPNDQVNDNMTLNNFAEEVKNIIGTVPESASEESIETGPTIPDTVDEKPEESDSQEQPAPNEGEKTEETETAEEERTPEISDETHVDDQENKSEFIPEVKQEMPHSTEKEIVVEPVVSTSPVISIAEASEKITESPPVSNEDEKIEAEAIPDEVFEVDDRDNEISKQDKGQLSALEKPALQCKSECLAKNNEFCDVVGGVAKCVCKRGFARLSDSAVCEKALTYNVSMILEALNGAPLEYSTTYEDKTKPRFLKLSNLVKRGVESAFSESLLANDFRGAELLDVKQTPTSTEGIRVDVLVHVKAESNISAELVQETLAKEVERTDFNVDGETIEPARQQTNSLVAEDFDECLHDMHDCPSNAECVNLKGTFTCKCKEGFEDLNSNSTDISNRGRVCAGAVQACTECNFAGSCKYDAKQNFLGCECREWYTGETCGINLKVLMIALVTIGAILLLLISCIILICCIRSRRAKGAISSGPSFLRYRGPGMPVGTLDRAAIIRGDTSSESSGGGLDNHGHTGDKSLRSTPPSTTTSPVATLQSYRPYGEGVGMLIPRAKHQHVTSYPTQTNLALTPEELAAREHQLIEYLEKGRGKRARLPSSARSTLERPPHSTFRRGSDSGLTGRSRSIDALSNVSESVHGDRISEVRSYDETTVRPAVKTPPYRNAKYEDDSSQFDSL